MQLDLAGKIVLVSTFAFNIVSGRMTISSGYSYRRLAGGHRRNGRADWRDLT